MDSSIVGRGLDGRGRRALSVLYSDLPQTILGDYCLHPIAVVYNGQNICPP